MTSKPTSHAAVRPSRKLLNALKGELDGGLYNFHHLCCPNEGSGRNDGRMVDARA